MFLSIKGSLLSIYSYMHIYIYIYVYIIYVYIIYVYIYVIYVYIYTTRLIKKDEKYKECTLKKCKSSVK